jgi:glutamate dehydrogenase
MKRALDELKAARLEEAVAEAGRGRRPELPGLVLSMFGRCPAEDLVAYGAGELVAFADAALSGLMLRVPGIHHIRIFNPAWDEDSEARKAVSVIEVVNDNMPFLVDSVMQELTDAGLEVRLMVHPILSVVRGMTGRLLSLGDAADPEACRESFIHIHVTRLPDAIATAQLESRLDGVLSEVRAAVDDWPRMKERLEATLAEYRDGRVPLSSDIVEETIAFLEWLGDDNFTFLGSRQFDLTAVTGEEHFLVRPGSGLGLLRDPGVRVLRRGRQFVEVTPELSEFMTMPEALIVAKANVKARVHRHAYLDYVGVKRFDANGNLVSEVRLLGLFTSSAYNSSILSIPYLRRKAAEVMRRAGFDADGHSGRALNHIVESFPRDELFQIDADTLQDFALAILELGERPRIRVLARRDRFHRFVSALVFAPRDRFSTENRRRIGDALATAFAGRVSSVYPSFPEGPLARVHYIIGRDEGETPEVSQHELELKVAAIIRTWNDGFEDACRARFGPARGRSLIEAYGNAFSEAYRASYSPEEAVADLSALELFAGDRSTAVLLTSDAAAPDARSRIRLRLFHRGSEVPLSRRVPLIEDMGFTVLDERTFPIARAGGPVVLHDMAIDRTDGLAIDLSRHDSPLRSTFMAVWLGAADSDRLNGLTISAGLGWREIAALRTLLRYLGQIGLAYDPAYLANALVANPGVAADLVALLHARFDPLLAGDRGKAMAEAKSRLAGHLDAVASLDEDRIFRRLANLIEAAVRTTFYAIGADGGPHPVMAFKFDARRIDGLPAPAPLFEIFLHSPRVEGVHLRFGRVARGGLRWSDRPQDFRTEVLGLVKAQQVKNACIVPAGAKGGFVARRTSPAMARADFEREGIEAYKLYVSTLIDLTDNRVGDRIVPPQNAVRHDGDDPYLVVAADKGTARFSDIANAIATARGFWLGDAFASGGSAGYDHKAMGITARGAWVAVRRHFRELGLDVDRDAFTAVGVGDMSGDVFGNAMLLTPSIRLIAAFDHRHIFLDPTPDPETSLAERRRLFALASSSWADYDGTLLSAGGGVFPRSAKSIRLFEPARLALGLDRREASPQEIVQAILKAPVDLLWFGGIGTFVRAEGETDADIADRANDGVRVTADAVRARVVGEGANLGVSPRARVVMSLAGVRLNSDAIDNAAGVNTSDVEVNVKIALAAAERSGRLDRDGRDRLLAAMTGDVAALVLANNAAQTLAISVSRERGKAEFAPLTRLMQLFEAEGRIDRRLDCLPDEATLSERLRSGAGLLRPEIATLLAHAKIALAEALIESRIVDHPLTAGRRSAYFPPAMRDTYAGEIAGHPLGRDIVATVLASEMIDRGGPAFAAWTADEAGVELADVARAYLVADAVFGIGDLYHSIGAAGLAADAELALHARLRGFVGAATLWVSRSAAPDDDPAALIDRLAGALDRRRLEAAPATPDAAPDPERRLAGLEADLAALDLVLIAEEAGRGVDEVAAVIAVVGELVHLGSVDALFSAVEPADLYEARAVDLARRELATAEKALALAALAEGGADLFATARQRRIARARRAIDGLAAGAASVAKLTVAVALVAELAAR